MSTHYRAADHRVWTLRTARITGGRPVEFDTEFVDYHGQHWHWDGMPFGTLGPDMVRDDDPQLREPLIGLVNCADLHSDPAESLAHGALIEQQHDAADAGLTQPGVTGRG